MLVVAWVLLLRLLYARAGYLTRTGICPHPTANFVIKDSRLNFYGLSYILPGDETPPCTMSECQWDNDCHGDRKCCSNHCGGYVCTETVREPRPCQYFTCPITKTCKLQKVQCIEPVCPNMLTIARPMCMNGGPLYDMAKKKRSRILSPSVFTDLSPPTVPEEPIFQRETSSWLTSLSPFWNGEENESINEQPTAWYGFYGRKKRDIKS